MTDTLWTALGKVVDAGPNGAVVTASPRSPGSITPKSATALASRGFVTQIGYRAQATPEGIGALAFHRRQRGDA